MLCLNVTHGCIPGKRRALGTVWECKSVIIAWHAYLKACCVSRGIKQLWRDILYVFACMWLADLQAFIQEKMYKMVACHWELFFGSSKAAQLFLTLMIIWNVKKKICEYQLNILFPWCFPLIFTLVFHHDLYPAWLSAYFRFILLSVQVFPSPSTISVQANENTDGKTSKWVWN